MWDFFATEESSLKNKPVIGITMGDAAGVGPEICLKAIAHPDALKICAPVVFGDASVLTEASRRCGLDMPPRVISPERFPAGAQSGEPTIVDFAALAGYRVRPSKVDQRCGEAAYKYIEAAISHALAGNVAAVATAPINKEALNLAGIHYAGHTEIFTERTGAKRSCMMLTSDIITCSLVTAHLPISRVSEEITADRVLGVIELTADAIEKLRGRKPRLIVCGLNPHAGESGLFGDEEIRAIIPAIETARRKGVDIEGPLSPDSAFFKKMRDRADAYVCMYHDQGLIPFKMIAFETGVNITLGLPIVRTSVDHGTAFDIAWQGKAGADSLIQAIRYAVKLSGNRQ